ncbi:hypothetical protein B7708_06925 [Streptococcus oralis subsp. dentisani]|uniref:Uncharacterized protein n=1 Tax=Streptococcus oralis subsp. dentisani TaxID=1458253 RepID=A0A1X1IY56_STROR|nr:hypothetical protein [Salmonella enterica subsp. enterica serovar Typhi]ORO77577.1 hypothetical protein B7708_06925 [Streptococcus oralis subsp. dentisani]ORO77959.1 hypothetical protein B7707_02655 [Streptococcus oralis subsp. dentisani]ORO82688.1 hypothetical protein B7705_04705 [Streptococcus oralis subsp. dentisani]
MSISPFCFFLFSISTCKTTQGQQFHNSSRMSIIVYTTGFILSYFNSIFKLFSRILVGLSDKNIKRDSIESLRFIH